jgi:hypothetical protein
MTPPVANPPPAVQILNGIGAIINRITDPAVSSSLTILSQGRQLTAGQVDTVNDFLSDPDVPLSASDIRIIRRGLANSQAASAASDSSAASPDDADSTTTPADDTAEQTRRILIVKNDTGQAVTLYLQYETLTDKNEWEWSPVDPSASQKAVRFKLKPGAKTKLVDDGFQINARRVRLWAKSADGTTWVEYKDNDLWLVPETNSQGEHVYAADEMETYTFSLTP